MYNLTIAIWNTDDDNKMEKRIPENGDKITPFRNNLVRGKNTSPPDR